MENKSSDIQQMDEEYPELDYLMNESESDVVFVVDGQRVPALKQLLSVKSKVFRAMFSVDFKESEEKEITIKETSYEAFKALIRFIFTEKLVLNDENDLNLLEEVIKLSDRYQVLRLNHPISEIIKQKINFENFERFCKFSHEFKFKPLIPLLKGFMEKNFKDFYQKDVNELKRINDMTDQLWFEVLNDRFFKAKNFYLNKFDSFTTYYKQQNRYNFVTNNIDIDYQEAFKGAQISFFRIIED